MMHDRLWVGYCRPPTHNGCASCHPMSSPRRHDHPKGILHRTDTTVGMHEFTLKNISDSELYSRGKESFRGEERWHPSHAMSKNVNYHLSHRTTVLSGLQDINLDTTRIQPVAMTATGTNVATRVPSDKRPTLRRNKFFLAASPTDVGPTCAHSLPFQSNRQT